MKNIIRNILVLATLMSVGVHAEEKMYDLDNSIEELEIRHINFKLVHSSKMGKQMKVVANELTMKCLHVGIRGDNATIKCKRGAKQKMADESVTVYADLSLLENLKVVGATGVVEGDITVKGKDDFDIDVQNGANVTFTGTITAPEVEVKVNNKSTVKLAKIDGRLDSKAHGKSKILYQNVTGAIEIEVSKDSKHGKVAGGWW